VQNVLVELTQSSPELPRPVALSAALILLSVWLAGLHFRHGSILDSIRHTLTYRLILASIAGWLSAWFLLPFSFFPIPETRGYFIPGAIFGALVMAPMLDDPRRHRLRAAILVWAATVAYAMMWFAGMVIIEIIEAYGPQLFNEHDGSPLLGEEAFVVSILGGTTGILFGVIVSVAMSWVLNLHFARIHWFVIIIPSAIYGTAYTAAVTEFWPEWLQILDRHAFAGSSIFLTHVLWYVTLGAVFNRGSREPLKAIAMADYVLLGGLILLSALVGWSLGLENYPYEWAG
jgi:hypothetical protein